MFGTPIFEIPRIEIYRDCTVLVWLRWVGPQKWGHLTTQPVVVSSIDVFCRKSLMFPYVPIVSRVFPYVPIKNGDVPMKTWWIDHEKSERPGPLWWLGSGGSEGLEIWKFMGIYIYCFFISHLSRCLHIDIYRPFYSWNNSVHIYYIFVSLPVMMFICIFMYM